MHPDNCLLQCKFRRINVFICCENKIHFCSTKKLLISSTVRTFQSLRGQFRSSWNSRRNTTKEKRNEYSTILMSLCHSNDPKLRERELKKRLMSSFVTSFENLQLFICRKQDYRQSEKLKGNCTQSWITLFN